MHLQGALHKGVTVDTPAGKHCWGRDIKVLLNARFINRYLVLSQHFLLSLLIISMGWAVVLHCEVQGPACSESLYSNDQLGEAHHGPLAVRMLSPEGAGSIREIRHLYWMSSTVPWLEPASPQMVWGSFLGKGMNHPVMSAVLFSYAMCSWCTQQPKMKGEAAWRVKLLLVWGLGLLGSWQMLYLCCAYEDVP